MQPQMRWSKNPEENLLGSFSQSASSANADLNMTQMGVVGTDAAIPRLPNQNGENDFSLAIGLCVLHKKVELGILCLQTRGMQTAFAKPSCEETLCIPHSKGNTAFATWDHHRPIPHNPPNRPPVTRAGLLRQVIM